MGLMKRSFEHAELSDGTGSREQGDDRRRDEEAWSRMDDEGRPNAGSQAIADTNSGRVPGDIHLGIRQE